MNEVELNRDLKTALCDRVFGWELVEFLQVPIEDIVELFEEDILDNLKDIKEFINYYEVEDDDAE